MTRFFHSVGTRLSLALLLVVAAALGIVYLAVIPSLQSRLEKTRVTQLEQDARDLRPQMLSDTEQSYPIGSLQEDAETYSRDIGARVAVLPSSLTGPIADSSSSGADLTNDPIAGRAVARAHRASGTVTRNEKRYGEAAVPLGPGYVLLVSDSLDSQLGSVHLVQRRVLLSAGAALLIALLLGYGGAWIFARRIRRLERAADRIAGGHFDEPVHDSGGDELGDLAAAFDRMRVRLAQLENARREFVANASHELRTPLFSLSGFLELLDDEELDEPTRREFLDSMRDQVDRLTKLASDLLDLSRLDAGRLHVEREPVDLGALGRDLVEEFGPGAAATLHQLEHEGNGATALGDELRVLQIGRILVENAIRHTPPGTPVRVRTAVRDGKAVIEVEDAGGGIPQERQDQLFDRFFRLDGTRASGSGLGLAIARQLAELMDGAVTVESAAGRTVFALRLPLAARQEPAQVPLAVLD